MRCRASRASRFGRRKDFGLEFGEEVSVCSFGQLHETARRHHGRERYDDASCQVDQGLIR